MRGWTAILLAMALFAPLDRVGAQIEYVPVSYDVGHGHGGNPAAKYEVASGRLKLEVSSEGVRADEDGGLPVLGLRMEIENKSRDTASIPVADQRVTADGWGELSPVSALAGEARIADRLDIQPGKKAKLDLLYDLSRVVDPARADRFTLSWSFLLPGGPTSEETLFRQVTEAPRMVYAAPYPWGGWGWRSWWGFDPFFARSSGLAFLDPFFDPFFGCDPLICGRRVVILRDRDDSRFPDRGRGSGGHPVVTPTRPARPAPSPAPALSPVLPRRPATRTAPWPALRGVTPGQTSAASALPFRQGTASAGAPRGAGFESGVLRGARTR